MDKSMDFGGDQDDDDDEDNKIETVNEESIDFEMESMDFEENVGDESINNVMVSNMKTSD